MKDTEERIAGRGSRLRTAFRVLGYIALALQAWNMYLFIGLIGR